MSNRFHPRVKRTREDIQQCKDCKQRFDAEPLPLMDCATCNGQGFIAHRAPYRLADGTWSDGVDRTHKLSTGRRGAENPDRIRVVLQRNQAGFYRNEAVALKGQYWLEPAPMTFAEAIAFADKHARTTTNGGTSLGTQSPSSISTTLATTIDSTSVPATAPSRGCAR